ncbi:MAG: hypothetical protein P1U32_03470 [Legionellaceae bacterium]|nr:hypothetical protein [Legionellaceae bacterium]
MAVKIGEASILTGLSFEQLEKPLQEKVLQCARSCSDKPKDWPIDAKQVLFNRLDLPHAVARSKRAISEIEPALFPFLKDDPNRAKYYEEELSFAFYLALADCELALLDKQADLADKRAHLLHIGGLLAQLRNRDRKAAEAAAEAKLASDPDDPAHYFGLLFIAPKMAEAIKKITIDKVSQAVDYPASLNDGRLYLVWAAEMMSNVCLILRHSFRYLSFFAADAILSGVSFVTGAMGWMLYFLRGGIDTAFLFEVSNEIKVLQLSEKEKEACFLGKWHEKKFSILNDAVWGLVNCVCFFILTGDGMLGWGGNALNGALFVFDWALAMWQWSEVVTAHEALMKQYQTDIDAITLKLARDYDARERAKAAGIPFDKNRYDAMVRSEWRLKALMRDKRKADREWSYQIKQLRYDTFYSGTIILAFAVLCCFFVLPGAVPAATALMFAMLGSALCFGLGIVHAALSSRLSISKTGEDSDDLRQDYKDYLRCFGEAGEADHLKRMIFLDIRRTMANTEYQKQLVQYQRADMVCRIITDMLIPTLFLASFVFMPLMVGSAAFAIGCVLILAAKCYVAELAPEDVRDESIPLTMLTKFSGFFKGSTTSKKEEDTKEETHDPLLPEPFPEAEYKAFCADFEKGASGESLRKHFLPKPQSGFSNQVLPGEPSPEVS